MTKKVSAGIVIYRRTKQGPLFLLLYHGKGYWNFPKGTLEEGERSFKAALREIKEETGLLPADLRFSRHFKAYNRYIFTAGRQKIFKIVVFYLAETQKSEIKVSDEHEGYAWFLYRDAVRILRHKNLKPILKKAHDLIRGKSLQSSPKNPAR